MTKLRPCYVTTYKQDPNHKWKVITGEDVKALFHHWSQKSEIVPPSPMAGGHNGGVVSGTVAVVEFEDGRIAEVNPTDIRFIDQLEHDPLAHPESYLDDAIAIVDNMTQAQRVELLKHLERRIEGAILRDSY